ncbi:MAG: efflux RND transporter periplasmic adaptor subunit [Sphingomonadales bacterium]|nr:efflux RND transporter periplasmic adaptor subunit [Sphingomonadales bacterium]MDE2171578.1 efflux RND transporter periplasmic adaptor subunit [Sphingomonadales bacterium]
MEHLPTDGQSTAVPNWLPKRQWQVVVAMAALVLIGFWVVPGLLHSGHEDAPPAAAHDDGSFAATPQQWDTLRFARVQTQPWGNDAQSDGRIATDDDLTTPVFSPFTGQVTRIMVKVGDHVSQGQPLFAVAASEAAQSDADIKTASAAEQLAQANADRLQDLVAHKGAALKDLQQARSDLAAAQATLSAAQGRRRALGSGIVHGEGIVRAPVSGVVTQRLIGLGQNVSSAAGGGATQAFTISNFSRVWLVGNLREEDAARAHVGQIALVRLPDGEALRAPLTYVAPALDPNSRRLTVRAEIANRDGHLKPETYVSFTLETGQEHQVLTVPEEAVIFEGATARVWVADMASHRLALRPITAGQVGGGLVEVTGGLRAGETVVTAGSLFIDRGAKAD